MLLPDQCIEGHFRCPRYRRQGRPVLLLPVPTPAVVPAAAGRLATAAPDPVDLCLAALTRPSIPIFVADRLFC